MAYDTEKRGLRGSILQIWGEKGIGGLGRVGNYYRYDVVYLKIFFKKISFLKCFTLLFSLFLKKPTFNCFFKLT